MDKEVREWRVQEKEANISWWRVKVSIVKVVMSEKYK